MSALHRLPLKTVLFGGVYTGVLFGILFGAPAVRWVLESRPFRFLGLISYSFYVWHYVVLNVVSSGYPALASLDRSEVVVARLSVGLVLSLLVAYVSYQLTERPFIRSRKAAHDHRVEPGSA